MPQALADKLGWVGKSRTLADSLERAGSYARKLGHAQVRLDHLLLALTEDLDAVMVLGACHVDTARLRMDLHQRLAHVGQQLAPNDPRLPEPDEEMRKVFDYASQAADQSRRGHIDGAIVLAALIGEATTDAADLLRSYGMTFEEVIRSLQTMGPATAQPQPQSQPATDRPQQMAPAPAQPSAAPPVAARYAPPPRPVVADVPEPTRRPPEPQPPRAPPPPMQAPALGQRPFPAAMDGPPRPYGAPPPSAPANAPYANGHHAVPFPAQPPTFQPQQPYQQPKQPGPPQYQSPPPPNTGRPMPAPGFPSIARGAAPPPPDELDPRLHPAPQGPPPQQQRPAPAVETGQLVERIPRVMRVATTETVEVRIARAKMDAIAEGMQGRGAPQRHEIFITRAMTVRLRAPAGGFKIETLSPETQWLDGANRMGLAQDEFAAWKFAVTPEQRGTSKLQLVVAVRTVGADGLVAETSLPEQTIDVKVKVNYTRTLKRVAGWMLWAVIGGVLGMFGESAFRMGFGSASKMVARLLLPH